MKTEEKVRLSAYLSVDVRPVIQPLFITWFLLATVAIMLGLVGYGVYKHALMAGDVIVLLFLILLVWFMGVMEEARRINGFVSEYLDDARTGMKEMIANPASLERNLQVIKRNPFLSRLNRLKLSKAEEELERYGVAVRLLGAPDDDRAFSYWLASELTKEKLVGAP